VTDTGNKGRARVVLSGLTRRTLITLALALATGCDKSSSTSSTTSAAASSATSSAKVAAPSAPPSAVVDAGLRVLEKVEIPEVRVKPGVPTTVQVTWLTPKGTAVNDEAPFRVRWNRSDGLVDAPADVNSTGSQVKNGFSVKVQPMQGAPNATLDGEINIVVCDDVTHALCVPVKRTVGLGFVVVKDAADEAKVSIPLPAAK
jgi:hypothetical protein